MKKSVIKLSGKIFLPLFVVVLMASCTSNDTSPATTAGTDSSMMVNTDTMMSDHTNMVTSDTNSNNVVSNADSLARLTNASASPLKTDKKSRKGKVRILPAPASVNTTAMEMDKEGFYSNTEVLPAFPGGQKALERFFENNIQYPDQATENDVQGTVKLTFSVDENGKVYQPVSVGEKVGYGIEEEALRVFNKMPKWTPGKIKGKNVKTRYTLPISFQIF